MIVTEVRIKLVEKNSERLLAFCSVTLDDCFVVRDLKLIEGVSGCFVAMPSRKLADRCPRCGSKNHLRSRFCNHCGCKLDETRAIRGCEGRAKLYADVAHPIRTSCRDALQSAVVRAYEEERERSRMPGYVCRYDDAEASDFDYAPTGDVGHAPHDVYAGPHRPVRDPSAEPAPREFGAGVG